MFWKHPVSPSTTGFCRYPYDHHWTFQDGERIPTVVEVAYVERFSHELAEHCPADPQALYGLNYEGEHQWSTKDSSPTDDLNAFANWLRSPGYQAALAVERRAHSDEMKRRVSQLAELAALIRTPGPRPDLIVIDGIGYGKDDALPPPFGSGA